MRILQSIGIILLCFIISGCDKPKIIVVTKRIKPKPKHTENIKVPLTAFIHFDPDDYRIREEEVNKILLIVNWAIQEMQTTGKPLKLIIRGYSSWTDEQKNIQLSRYRAASVAKIILSKTRAIVLQIEYNTYLESMSIQNQNPNMREKMRLVEIHPYYERPVSFALPRDPKIGQIAKKTVVKKPCGCTPKNHEEAHLAKESVYKEIFPDEVE